MQEVFSQPFPGTLTRRVAGGGTAAQVVALPKCTVAKSASQPKWSKLEGFDQMKPRARGGGADEPD